MHSKTQIFHTSRRYSTKNKSLDYCVIKLGESTQLLKYMKCRYTLLFMLVKTIINVIPCLPRFPREESRFCTKKWKSKKKRKEWKYTVAPLVKRVSCALTFKPCLILWSYFSFSLYAFSPFLILFLWKVVLLGSAVVSKLPFWVKSSRRMPWCFCFVSVSCRMVARWEGGSLVQAFWLMNCSLADATPSCHAPGLPRVQWGGCNGWCLCICFCF